MFQNMVIFLWVQAPAVHHTPANKSNDMVLGYGKWLYSESQHAEKMAA